jgi:lysophospholipase L1-like esterase
MEKIKNYITRPIHILLLTVVFLTMFYLLPPEFEIFGISLKRVEIYSDLLKSQEDDTNDEIDNLFDDSTSSVIEFTKNDVLYAGFSIPFLSESPSGRKLGKEVPLQGNIRQLKNFFDALAKAKKQKVRIAHFGDSIIEGDLVTSQIREEFQKRFGGKGVGFLPITSQDVSFRQSMKLAFSDNWKSYSVFTSNPKHYPVAVSGEVFIPEGNAWVEYQTLPYFRRQKDFSEAYLYFTPDKKVKINYTAGSEKGNLSVPRKSGVVKTEIPIKGKVKKLKLEVPANSGKYYGVSLEAGNGVYVDNYALRGNSGVALKNIPLSQLKQFAKYLDYKLIILEFGVNALSNRSHDYTWYEKEMTDVVNNLKKAFPKAGIIIVGVHDKSKKKGSKFITDPGIPKLLKAQAKLAKKTNVAFWNLNKAMGGKNSMPKWVKANPPLAFMDYTHFNDIGAKRVAELFVKALLNAKNKVK